MHWICVTCATQFAEREQPPDACPTSTLLSGDVVMVIPDRRFVSFMWSYPNLIPLPAAEVQRIAKALEPWEFERILGAWWDRLVPGNGNEVVRRSADRYAAALTK